MNHRLHDVSAQVFRKSASGFAMVSALFILVALTALGVFVTRISQTQQVTETQDFLGVQAYHMARAGIEWGVYEVSDPERQTQVMPTDASWPNLPDCPAASKTMTFGDFTVVVTCTRYPAGAGAYYQERGSERSIRVYTLISTASKGTSGSTGYVERQLQVTVSNCRTSASNGYGTYECL